ncbi:MAG TPA: type I DNA topoisomerase [Actinomycetota bacterium]|nr:type I DNA topoisomerase [Actinomycetota bacterium]
MSKPLVVVESPAKAKTIAGILGADYIVESSIGHIRDLPGSASEIPAAYKNEQWARLGVDVESDFKPLYVVPRKKKDQVKKLKKLLSDASELYLATDEDREGESIAWHLLEVLSPTVPVRRMVFHEITKQAIQAAVANPRDLDRRLVDAQEGRRILDRLFGYEVSPVLWKKVMPKLSAGRVQSVATRMIVERERERMGFRVATYWDIEGTFAAIDHDADSTFTARLVLLDGRRLAGGKDFDSSGNLTGKDALLLEQTEAEELAAALAAAEFQVRTVDEKPFVRSPHPPFITSTLQQEAGIKLRFSAQRTMSIAQRLYENGFITYMRTDSTILSNSAIATARQLAARMYGQEFVPAKPRVYKSKSKTAQEAHEAIRPAGDAFRTPEEVAGELSPDELRLYDLVWKRTVASQMSDARGQSVSVRLGPVGSDARDAEFEIDPPGKVIEFPGFMRAYVEGADDPEAELEDREVRLPPLRPEDALAVRELAARPHSTQPPRRYSEASLVKELEQRGIGRPSTYASIIETIQDRGYVWKKGSALVPSWTAFAVVGLLERHFSKLVDYSFTARMEDDLDEIANGDEEAVPWLRRFYFGNGDTGLHALVNEHVDEIDPREVNSIPIGSDGSGDEIVVRVGRYGPYLQRGEDRASLPEDLPPDEVTVEKAEELLAAPSHDRELGSDPDTGLPIVVRSGRFGPYVQVGEMEEGSKKKPRTASLLSTMDPATITLEDALKVLSLPRIVGADPADGQEITVQTGRFGPYLKKGSDTRTLEDESQLFSLTLEEALALLAKPKERRRRTAAVLKELGTDPATQKPVVLKEGRFGPYVTDEETNASLPRGTSPASITLERASELLAEKRAKPPTKRRRKKA